MVPHKEPGDEAPGQPVAHPRSNGVNSLTRLPGDVAASELQTGRNREVQGRRDHDGVGTSTATQGDATLAQPRVLPILL